MMAMNAKVNVLEKKIEKRLKQLEVLQDDFDAKIAKLEGMGKFTYAWCKSAQEAGIFKMKQRY